jgi:predicted MFS family arabinose efflux permease
MLLVYALTQAPTKGWVSGETLAFFAGAVVLLGFFIWNEARSRHALAPLKFFRIGSVGGANITQLPITAAMFAMFFFITLYVQQILDYSPVMTGLGFLPITVIIGIISSQMPKIIHRFGYKRPVVVAPLFMAGALYYLSHMSVGGSYWVDIFPGLVLMAIGMGTIFITITIAATSGVPPKESGLASGLLNTSQQIGGALGLAILSGVSTAGIKSYITDHAISGQSADVLRANAVVHGFHDALLVGVGLVLLASLSAALFVRQLEAPEDVKVEMTPTA